MCVKYDPPYIDAGFIHKWILNVLFEGLSKVWEIYYNLHWIISSRWVKSRLWFMFAVLFSAGKLYAKIKFYSIMFSFWKKNQIEIELRIGQRMSLKWTSFDQKKRYQFNLEILAVGPYSKIPKFLAPKFKFRIWFCLIERIHFLSF